MLGQTTRSLRIIKIVNRRLGENIAAAIAGRVKRIAVELDWSPINRSDEQRNRAVSPRHRRRVIKEFPWNGPLDRFRERHEVQLRATATCDAEAGERD